MKDKYIIMADGKSPHTLKWVSELCKYFNLYLITLNGYDRQLLAYMDEEQIYVVNESVNGSGGNFKLLLKYFEIKKIVESIAPKYINAHYISSYGVLAALVKKAYPDIKLIQSAWGTDILVTPFENIIKKMITKSALMNADLITSDSYYMSDKIIEISANDKIDTFAFGLESFDLDEEIQKDEFLIFSNRMLSKNYNIDKIILWFSQLEDKRYKLVIAHDGEMKEELQQMVRSLNLQSRISFIGYITAQEQESNYRKAKYYISIPSSDATSVSLLEAMRYGCYPIVSNLPANREWIIDECNGSFFTEGMALPKVEQSVININKTIINKKAIFSKSIKNYISRLVK